jgi:hypothetical protein
MNEVKKMVDFTKLDKQKENQAGYEQEFNDYLARYAYMDTPEHRASVLNDWKQWSSRHEAIYMMIRDCFFTTPGTVDEEKLYWLVTTKLLDPYEAITACFTATATSVRCDDSRMWRLLMALVTPAQATP